MTYRTKTDKRRAIYILAAVAVAAILALPLLGNGMADCTASTDMCVYSLR